MYTLDYTVIFGEIHIPGDLLMQFEINVTDLMRRLAPLAQVIAKRTTIQAAENFLFSLGHGDSSLRACATNLDCTIETSCPIIPKLVPAMEKAFLVPGRRLMEIMRHLPPGGVLNFSLDGKENLHLQCEKTRFRLFSPPPETFPSPPPAIPFSMQIRAEHLRQAIIGMKYAIGMEESRFQLTGGQFVLEFPQDLETAAETEITGGFTLVGTDGHRLAFARQSGTLRVPAAARPHWRDSSRPPASVVIPRRTFLDLIPLLEDHASLDIDIGLTSEWNFFRIGNYRISTRNLGGMFPRYDTIVSTCPPKEVIMHTADMLAAARRVSILTDNLASGIRFTLSAGQVALESSLPQAGEAFDSIPVEYHGDNITIGLNVNYLIDALQSIPTRQFRFCFSDAISQIWLIPHPSEDENLDTSLRHIIMPLRFS